MTDIASMRDTILNTPKKTMDIATPMWPEFDGHIALQDVSANHLNSLEPLKTKNGAWYCAAILCKAMIIRETGERILQETDREALAELGTTVLEPIFTEASVFFGWTKTAVEDAKKN